MTQHIQVSLARVLDGFVSVSVVMTSGGMCLRIEVSVNGVDYRKPACAAIRANPISGGQTLQPIQSGFANTNETDCRIGAQTQPELSALNEYSFGTIYINAGCVEAETFMRRSEI